MWRAYLPRSVFQLLQTGDRSVQKNQITRHYTIYAVSVSTDVLNVARLFSKDSVSTNLEPGSTFGPVSHTDSPAVSVYHLIDDGQPEPCSILGGRVTNVEYVISCIFGDTGPIVFNVEAVIQFPNSNRHILAAVFNRVPYEILKELLEATPVSSNPSVDIDGECRFRSRHVPPAILRKGRQINWLNITRGLALVCQCQQVIDQRFHAFVGASDGVKLLAVTLFSDQFQSSIGNIQRIP